MSEPWPELIRLDLVLLHVIRFRFCDPRKDERHSHLKRLVGAMHSHEHRNWKAAYHFTDSCQLWKLLKAHDLRTTRIPISTSGFFRVLPRGRHEAAYVIPCTTHPALHILVTHCLVFRRISQKLAYTLTFLSTLLQSTKSGFYQSEPSGNACVGPGS